MPVYYDSVASRKADAFNNTLILTFKTWENNYFPVFIIMPAITIFKF